MRPEEIRIGNLFHPINRKNKIYIPETAIIYKVVSIDLQGVTAVEKSLNPALQEVHQEFRWNEMSPVSYDSILFSEYGIVDYEINQTRVACDQGDYYQIVMRVNNSILEFRRHAVMNYMHEYQNAYYWATGEDLKRISTPTTDN